MTRGVLIFAQNNSEIDYAKISLFAAEQVKRHLNVPVSLITDSKDWLLQSQPTAVEVFDQFITTWTDTQQTKRFYDGTLASKTLTWKNLNRSDCYDLTPYDETLVIDSDYIINSTNLSKIWNNQNDFLIYQDSFDLAQWRDDRSFRYLNQYAIPFYWATAFYFKKSNENQAFFDLVKHIKLNWSYFRALYNIDTTVFRNDFAFSIAIHMMGPDFANPLPGKMNYTLDRDVLVDIEDTTLKFLVEKKNYSGEYIATKTKNLDMHVMNKYSLTRYLNKEAQ
mgnify:CR=1 FL=1|jgi:hypothetical protein